MEGNLGFFLSLPPFSSFSFSLTLYKKYGRKNVQKNKTAKETETENLKLQGNEDQLWQHFSYKATKMR
jgi:hypothetical protein